MKFLKGLINILIIIIVLSVFFVSCVILVNSYLAPEEKPSIFGWIAYPSAVNIEENGINSGDLILEKNEVIQYKIPKLGNLIIFLNTPLGMLTLLLLPIGIYLLKKIIKQERERKLYQRNLGKLKYLAEKQELENYQLLTELRKRKEENFEERK